MGLFDLWRGSATTNAHQAETAAKNAATHYARIHAELATIRRILDNIESKVPKESRDHMYHYKRALQAYERVGKHQQEQLQKLREALERLEPIILQHK